MKMIHRVTALIMKLKKLLHHSLSPGMLLRQGGRNKPGPIRILNSRLEKQDPTGQRVRRQPDLMRSDQWQIGMTPYILSV